MSAGELKLLFRPFAQASEQIARRYGGAGLGLVFVKRIAKAMGGDLKVTSKTGPRQHLPSHRAGRARATRAASRAKRHARGARARVVDPLRRGQSLRPRGDEHDPGRTRPPRRFRRERRGGGEGGRARRLRRGADGRHAVGPRRHRSDAAHSRAAGQGRPSAGDRHFRPQRKRRRSRPRAPPA